MRLSGELNVISSICNKLLLVSSVRHLVVRQTPETSELAARDRAYPHPEVRSNHIKERGSGSTLDGVRSSL